MKLQTKLLFHITVYRPKSNKQMHTLQIDYTALAWPLAFSLVPPTDIERATI